MSIPLVSIVVPVYNEAEHIAQCLDSILAQTHQNWECIITDNCSTDASRDIANEYAIRDSRIRVVENREFLRAVANFNNALRQMSWTSKYCKLVFADDWIYPECLERMVDLAEEYPSVGIVGAYGLQGRQVMWAGLPHPSRLISGREISRKLFLENLYVFGTATSLLFRADLVRARDPFFDESNLHSDSDACLALLKTCDFGFINQVLTFTRVRENSLFAFSSGMNTFIAGRLHDLVAHGRDCLDPTEFNQCLDRKVSEYYAFLSGNLIRRRDSKFWDYHKEKLKEAGVEFSRTRLAATFLGKVIRSALSPYDALERQIRARTARRDMSFLDGFKEPSQSH